MDNNRLNQLFNEARSQAPKASFDKTKDRFINSINTGGKPSHSNQFFNSKLFKTLLIMTSSIAIIGISLFIWNKAPNEDITSIESKEVIEHQNITKVNSIQPYEISIGQKKINATPEKITTPIVFVNTASAKSLPITTKTPVISAHKKKINEEEGGYIFPTLTAKEIKETLVQKRGMLKKLARRERKLYAFIPSGPYQDEENGNVSIQGFYMQTAEVSVLEYRTFLFDLLIQDRKEEFLKAKPDQQKWSEMMGGYAKPLTDHYFSHEAYNDYPINNISREGALMYCKWLTEELRKSEFVKKNELINDVRLPTTYEWMYAASGGGKQAPYPWGGPYLRNARGCFLANFKPGKNTSPTCDSWNKLKGVDSEDSLANFIQTMDDVKLPKISDNPYSADGGLHTVKVFSYNPNDFGLYCMSGNVAEMVYDPNFNTPSTKGGSWLSTGHELQITSKGIHEGETGPMVDVGFRPVISYLGKEKDSFNPFGAKKISQKFYMDESEVTNFMWKEYLSWLAKTHGKESTQYTEALPDTNVWESRLKYNAPYKRFYFMHVAYNNYPVVGISYEQAVNFCKWRTDRVKEYIKINGKTSFPKNFRYRLPTKTEWENVAKIGFNEKTKKALEGKYKGQPTANFKMEKPKDGSQLKNTADITAPAKSYWSNSYGIFNLKGNVAEMTLEKGIAKGGSWIHTEEESDVKKDFSYQQPQCWLGFRCVFEVLSSPE